MTDLNRLLEYAGGPAPYQISIPEPAFWGRHFADFQNALWVTDPAVSPIRAVASYGGFITDDCPIRTHVWDSCSWSKDAIARFGPFGKTLRTLLNCLSALL